MMTTPRKKGKRKKEPMALTPKQKETLDKLLESADGDAEAIAGENGLLDAVRKHFLEAVLKGEMTAHLGYAPHDPAGRGSGNSRNGHTAKTVQTKNGALELRVPRDRDGSFEPQVVRKRQRRIDNLDGVILSLYGGGVSERDIQAHLLEIYGVEVSATLISNVIASIMEEVKEWQARALDAVYPIVYFDCLFVKCRVDGSVRNVAVYLALGVSMEGQKELLGLWVAETEGAKFWLRVFTELKARGLEDCMVACVDGLAGLPEAIESVFPQTQVQLCIVHKVRNSLKYVSYKFRKEVAADLKQIYQAPTEEAARDALGRFDAKWSEKYPAIVPGWERDWERLTPLFSFPPEIRKVVYTTNAIESLNYSLRKVIKGRGAFPNEDAVRKVLYLALRKASEKWTMPLRNWSEALNQFIILYGDRMPV